MTVLRTKILGSSGSGPKMYINVSNEKTRGKDFYKIVLQLYVAWFHTLACVCMYVCVECFYASGNVYICVHV